MKYLLIRGASLVALTLIGAQVAFAADHIDAPGAVADPAADITDFFAWERNDSTIVVVVNFDGQRTPVDEPIYDRDVLYTVHIDTDGNGSSSDANDRRINVRFGQDASGNDGFQILGLPGNDAVSGPVDRIVPIAGGSVFVGPREDPFFFDFTGFSMTLSSAALAFDSTRDDFASTNVTSIVLEFDADLAFDDGVDSNSARLWASTSRISTPEN